MNEQTDSNYILSRDGLKLNCVIRHVENPKAVVCILHGHGEHVGRYDHVMDFLNENKIACIALDFRGHGLSEGRRGHMPSMDHVLNDVEEALKFVRVNYLDIPMFLFGHSFGGCVTLNYILKKPISDLTGFIASSPWLALAFKPPEWKVKLGKVLAGFLPKFTMASELDPELLSKEKEVCEEYIQDPLVHNKVSSKFFQEVTDAGHYALENAATTKVKGLMYHGNADKIIDFDATKTFAKKSKKWVDFHELEGVYHEPHNDSEREEVLKLIFSWVSKMTTKT